MLRLDLAGKQSDAGRLRCSGKVGSYVLLQIMTVYRLRCVFFIKRKQTCVEFFGINSINKIAVYQEGKYYRLLRNFFHVFLSSKTTCKIKSE